MFVLGSSGRRDVPLETLTGETEADVERDLRAWVEAHFPASSK